MHVILWTGQVYVWNDCWRARFIERTNIKSYNERNIFMTSPSDVQKKKLTNTFDAFNGYCPFYIPDGYNRCITELCMPGIAQFRIRIFALYKNHTSLSLLKDSYTFHFQAHKPFFFVKFSFFFGLIFFLILFYCVFAACDIFFLFFI